MPAAYKYYYWVISEPQAEAGLVSYFWDWALVFFVLACWGFAPRRSCRNGNPSSGAPGCSMKEKEAKQRGKKMEEKDISEGFSFFENFLYFKIFIIYF